MDLPPSSLPPLPGARVAVGVLRVKLRVPGARGLKDRRQVSHALRDRLRQRFDVAACLLEENGPPTALQIAVSLVGSDPAHVERTLRQVRDAMTTHPSAIVVDVVAEVLAWPSTP